MEKLKLDYGGTGIKTLRSIALIALIIGILLAIIIGFVAISFNGDYKLKEYTLYPVVVLVLDLIITFVVFAICRAIALIAENALYQKEYLIYKAQKEEITFIERVPEY